MRNSDQYGAWHENCRIIPYHIVLNCNSIAYIPYHIILYHIIHYTTSLIIFYLIVSVYILPCRHTLKPYHRPCHILLQISHIALHTVCYHTVPYHIAYYHMSWLSISYPVILYTIPCRAVPCLAVPCHMMQYHIIPCGYLIISYYTIP